MSRPQELRGYTRLLVQQLDNVVTVQINRPAVKNAIDRRTVYDLVRVLDHVTHDDNVIMVLLSGVGDAFTSGVDLRQIGDYRKPDEYLRTANLVLKSLVKSFLNCPKLVVALVNGPCFGIGFTLSALCDLVYCSRTAYFVAPFTRLGMCPEACASYMFPLIFGKAKAAEILYFGVAVSAQEALDYGFVAAIYEDDGAELRGRLREYAAKLPKQSLMATKRLLGGQSELYARLPDVLGRECKELAVLRRGEAYKNAFGGFKKRASAAAATAVNKSKL